MNREELIAKSNVSLETSKTEIKFKFKFTIGDEEIVSGGYGVDA